MKEERLNLKKMLIFGSGDLYGGGAQVIISFFYLIFLTDVVGLRPSLAGLIVLIARIWDAISDPLMGHITDRTKTRWGRRRPYFFLGFFLIILSYSLLWFPTSFQTDLGKFIFCLTSYLFYSTVVTMVMVPYSAFSAEISRDYEERNKANGFRLFFSQFASLLGAVLPLTIVALFTTEKTGYGVMGLVFGIFFAIPFLLIFIFLRESQYKELVKTKFSLKSFFKPFKVRTFRILIGLYIGAFITMDVISAIFAYFMRYYLNRPDDTTIVLGILLISVVVLLPFVVYGANNIGKGKTFSMGAFIAMVGVVLLALLPQDVSIVVVYIVASVVGIGLAPCMVIPWFMFPDATDAGELKFGERNEGSFSGIMTFVRKSTSAVAIFAVGVILDIAGYIEPITNADGSQTYFDQPEQVLNAFKIIVAVIPIVLMSTAIYLALIYPLNKQRHDKLRSHLESIKKGENSPLTDEEIQKLNEDLV